MSLTEIVALIAQLVFLEGVLSIDNAAVLGVMVSGLPTHAPVPWPARLRRLAPRGDRLLGGQQAAALKVGLLGAYAGRALMLVLASYIIRSPWLHLLGAAYLLKLACSHLALRPQTPKREPGPIRSRSGQGFWMVVLTVELTDLAFSIDSVLVAVALSSNLMVVLIGLAIGMAMMRFAAQAFITLIKREPVLAPAAYVLVLLIALELLLGDAMALTGRRLDSDVLTRFLISALVVAAALAYAHNPRLHQMLHPFVRGLRAALTALNQVFDGLLLPFKLMAEGMMIMVRALI